MAFITNFKTKFWHGPGTHYKKLLKECQLKVTVSVFFGWTLRGDKIKRKVFDEGILYIRDLIYHT